MIAYPAIFHKMKHGFWVEFPDLPGCVTEGSSLEHAKKMAKEALTGILEVRLDYDEPIRRPSMLQGERAIWIEPELTTSIALSLRIERKKRGHTMKALAKRMNVSVGEVQRLEDPRRSNPTLEKLARVCEALELDVRDLFSKRAA